MSVFAAAALSGWSAQEAAAGGAVREVTHLSQVMNAERVYRVFFPAAYDGGSKRYPVIYWLHGFESEPVRDSYSKAIEKFVGGHDVLVVDAGPVETTGNFPMYVTELVERVDQTLRTIPNRDHRGITGYALGGYMALWTAAKYPDLVGSASDFLGSTEAPIGPKGYDVDCDLAALYGNLSGVRTRLVAAADGPASFYNRQLGAIWSFGAESFEMDWFRPSAGPLDVAKTLDFHMHAFAQPLPKPTVFSHADVYPNFSIWGWEVATERRQPGFTWLERVSPTAFRSSVREWLPGGAALKDVKVSIETPAKTYAPGSTHPVTIVRLRDGQIKRAVQKADAEGRLSFDLDGDAYDVGISAAAQIDVAAYDVADAPWATAGQPVKLNVKFRNVGSATSGPISIQWETPNTGVKLDAPIGRVSGLVPGESVALPITFTVQDPSRQLARIVAVVGGARIPFDVPLYPAAETAKSFMIADGRPLDIYQAAARHSERTLGEGNGDGFAGPGESFAILLPDGNAYRAAELITNDPCFDTSVRGEDSWNDYDGAGASVKYTVAKVNDQCPQGHRAKILAKVMAPSSDGPVAKYWTIEFPVWWKNPDDAFKKK